jgi:hypothetical protein
MKVAVIKLIRSSLAFGLLAAVFFAFSCSDNNNSSTGPEVPDSTYTLVFDDTIEPGDSVHLNADTTYLFSGFVFVENGAVLSIDAGTVLKFRPGQGVNASALIVARGGKIYANGTAEAPIIMTAEADDINDPSDLPVFSKGLWGGLIILGAATNNNPGGIGQIEGIPSDEPRGEYGGVDDNDNSGVVRYVSIRHGGTEIGAGNEINGLTLGSVGSGTTIEHVEIYSNVDDGVEFFGGTVRTKYIAVAFCGDDCFDYDEGFRGQGQFWFGIQESDNGNHAGEHDGATGNEQGTPYAHPIISNATYIGSGVGSANSDNDPAIIMRDNAGGEYHNSIFYDFNGSGLEVEDLADPGLEDSRARLEDGEIVYRRNVWYGFDPDNSPESVLTQDFVRTVLTQPQFGNEIADPELGSIDRGGSGGLDPRPSVAGVAGSGAVTPSGGFFDNVSYKGAFDPAATPWINGWTALSAYNFTQ